MAHPIYYVPAGDVLPVFFDTYDGGTGASITATGLAVTDIEIYKDGSVTQRASDAGYTLLDTDGLDFDGLTGIHGFSIDTGDNTDASFYTVGAWFTVVVSAITVDAQTVSFIACQFRLMAAESVAGKPKVDVDAWLGTAAATPSVAGVPEVDVTHVGGTAQTAGDLKASLNTIDDFLDTEVAAILAAVDTEITAIDDLIDTEVAAIKTVVDSIETKVDTIDNFLDTEIQTLITMLTGIVPINGTIGATGNSTTTLHLSGIAWGDDGPNSMLLLVQDVSGSIFVSRWIEDFATATDLATVATLPFTPEASVDKYWLIPVRADVTGGSGLDAAGVRAAIGLASANLDTQIGTLATAAALATVDDFLDTEIAAIKAKTDNLPAAPAAVGDIPTVAAIADGVWDEAVAGHVAAGTFGKTDADILAAVDTEIAAIKAKTDNLPADPADASDIAASFAALNNLSAAQVNAEADTAIADALNSIADAILDRAAAVEGYTPRQLLRLFAAVLVGKADGLATTTAHYRDVADTKNRITATVDADGNRTALTLDAT